MIKIHTTSGNTYIEQNTKRSDFEKINSTDYSYSKGIRINNRIYSLNCIEVIEFIED